MLQSRYGVEFNGSENDSDDKSNLLIASSVDARLDGGDWCKKRKERWMGRKHTKVDEFGAFFIHSHGPVNSKCQY